MSLGEDTTVIDALHERLRAAVSSGTPCLFLSPHLDDAVLSCGTLISALVMHCPVTVVTLFSAAGHGPHTSAARSYLRHCGATDAGALYEERQREDRAVLGDLGAAQVHVGMPDALFRRRQVGSGLVELLGRAIPELVHRYPTYRFDIARGRIARGDRALIDDLSGRVARVADEVEAGLVFCPLAVGGHVDHVITRMLGERDASRVVYYSDFPYDQSFPPDQEYLVRKRLQPWTWDDGTVRRPALIRGYRTQVPALFPDGDIPLAPETYFLPTPRPSERPRGTEEERARPASYVDEDGDMGVAHGVIAGAQATPAPGGPLT